MISHMCPLMKNEEECALYSSILNLMHNAECCNLFSWGGPEATLHYSGQMYVVLGAGKVAETQ